MNAPRLVTIQIVRPNPALLSPDKKVRDAFLDEMIEWERQYQEAMSALPETPPMTAAELQHLADIDAEKRTEGQRTIPKPNYRLES